MTPAPPIAMMMATTPTTMRASGFGRGEGGQGQTTTAGEERAAEQQRERGDDRAPPPRGGGERRDRQRRREEGEGGGDEGTAIPRADEMARSIPHVPACLRT